MSQPTNINDSPPGPVSVESPDGGTEPIEETGVGPEEMKRPALHIDIQIHIDPTSSAELIDTIFASMAKHLYGIKP